MREHDHDYDRELRGYLTGFGLALVLTLAAFGIALWGNFDRTATITTVGVLGLVQIVVQTRFFLHVDLSRQKREDLQLILFSTLLLVIMVVGTIWILGNLAIRM